MNPAIQNPLPDMPTLFVSHGTPLLALDTINGNDYTQWSHCIPKPKAILVFSAHWESEKLTIGRTTTHDSLVYDFFGFPENLYKLQYPAPGSPWLAEKLHELLGDNIPFLRSDRGLDHGVWVPFLHMWPKADVPILQISMPANSSNQALFELGARLAPLKKQGVLIVTSGMVTHNLSKWNLHHRGKPAEWAKAFDYWVKDILLHGDIHQLLQWQTRAPYAKKNHPTPEHFRTLLIAAGTNNMQNIIFPIEGFEAGIFSRRSVQFN